jgi:hypothetical protein
MHTPIKIALATTVAAGAVVGGLASPASASPVAVGNLVNVQISNVLNNNDVNVAVPINAAAAICGVDVNVLATATDLSSVTCAPRANQTVTLSNN